jgi:hypothetical protein
MKLRGACLVSCLLSLAAAARADVVVSGSRQTGTRDCSGGAAIIDGNDADLKLQNCKTLTVNGNGNRVAAGAVEAMTVLGNRNSVTWTAGPNGRRPQVANLGNGNSVSEAGGSGSGAGAGAATSPRARSGSGDATLNAGGGSVNVSNGGTTVNIGPGGVTVGGAAVAGANAVTVTGSGTHTTHDCKGSAASVTGDNNQLTFRNCVSISVTGDDNTIDAGTAQGINVTGDRNTITWQPRAGGGKPSISNTGDGNVIKQGS